MKFSRRLYPFYKVEVQKGVYMDQEIEKLLHLVSDMEEISPEDELSALIQNSGEEELSEFDLDMVSAASSGPDYRKFEERVKQKGQKW